MFTEDPKTLMYARVKNGGETRIMEYLRHSEARRTLIKGGARLARVIESNKGAAPSGNDPNPVDAIRNSKKEEYLKRLENRVRNSALEPSWHNLNKLLQNSENSHRTFFDDFNSMIQGKGVQLEDDKDVKVSSAQHSFAFLMDKSKKEGWKPMTIHEIKEAAEDRFYDLPQNDDMRNFLLECHTKAMRGQNLKKQEELLNEIDRIRMEVSLQKMQARRQKEKEIEKLKTKDGEISQTALSDGPSNRQPYLASGVDHLKTYSSSKKSVRNSEMKIVWTSRPRADAMNRVKSFNRKPFAETSKSNFFENPSKSSDRLHGIYAREPRNFHTRSEVHLESDYATSERLVQDQMQTNRPIPAETSDINKKKIELRSSNLAPPKLLQPFRQPKTDEFYPYMAHSHQKSLTQQLTNLPSKSTQSLPKVVSTTRDQPSHALNVESSSSKIFSLQGRLPIHLAEISLAPRPTASERAAVSTQPLYVTNQDGTQKLVRRGPQGLYRVTDVLNMQQKQALRGSLTTRKDPNSLVDGMLYRTIRR